MNARLSYGKCRCGKPIVYKGAGFCSPQCQEAFSSNILGFDTETELIRPGRQIPPLVCASFAMGEDAELVHWRDARPVVESMLQSDCLIVGHHLAFDFAVLCENFPELTPLIFEVYWADRVSDTLIREKLGHIARGFYRRYETLDGDKLIPVEYSLEAVARRRLQIQLDKGAESWRLRYGELRDLPLAQWPEPAKEYALDDARILLPVWEQQEQAHSVLIDQYRQARAAFWLQLMSAWGLHTDANGVRAFEKKTQQKYDSIAVELKVAGLMRANGVRDTKAVKALVISAYEKRTDVKLPKTPKGNVKTDEDTCKRSGDELLLKYSELSSLKKTLSTDIPLLMQGICTPIHTKFESLVATGRTASSPNVQNLPVAAGVRECFVPRPGMLFASADFSGFELRTWAQVCLELFGHSRLAEALNAGNDPHLEMARRMLDISYKEAERLHLLGDDKVYKARQSGKVANFGFPGGLGFKRFVEYARMNYGVILDPDVEKATKKARDLKQFWLEAWPESKEYFDYIGRICEVVVPSVEQLYVGRVRSDVGFTDACNSLFQGLAADAAKNAGFLIARACYAQSESVLYGCRPVNFVHDEFILEVPDDEFASDAAEELARLMVEGAKPFLPDVEPKAEPQLMRRWSKKAKAIRDENKRLVPWDWEEAA